MLPINQIHSDVMVTLSRCVSSSENKRKKFFMQTRTINEGKCLENKLDAGRITKVTA